MIATLANWQVTRLGGRSRPGPERAGRDGSQAQSRGIAGGMAISGTPQRGQPVGCQPPSSEKTCSATDGCTSESVTAGLSKFCEKKSAAATGSVWLFSSSTRDCPISFEL
jgi:hypothetical protein